MRARGLPRPFVTRRTLQLALALLWILDGALQLQPIMFTRGFADRVIAPAAAGQPLVVAAAVHFSAALIRTDPFVWDAMFAAAQLVIGAALLSRRTARLGIALTIAWSLGVWILGEGLGGMAGGTATFLTGAPGAAVLYALIALAAWSRLSPLARETLTSRSVENRTRAAVLFTRSPDDRPAPWVPAAWAAVWGLFVVLGLLPAEVSGRALGAQLLTSSAGAPGWLVHAQASVAAAAGRSGFWPVLVLAVVETAVALAALRRGAPRRIAAVLGIGVALAVWVLGQAFGQIPTGMGTDPSSAPLVALLGFALLGSGTSERAALEGTSTAVVPIRT